MTKSNSKDSRPLSSINRRQAIIQDHAEHPHPEVHPKSMRLHLLIHELVEKQIADRDPPEVLQALERLQQGGLERHQAVHAIGVAMARQALAMWKKRNPLDRAAYIQQLAGLTVESYRQSLGDKPEKII